MSEQIDEPIIKPEEYDQFKNIMAFLFIMLEEWDGSLLSLNPRYVKEKYLRYVQNPQFKNEYLWGLHPILKRRLQDYCVKYDIPFDSDEPARGFHHD